MNRRWKVLAVACATALAMPEGVAVAHDPEEVRRHAADGPDRPRLLVLQELPDRGEPVQRGEHARHQLRHRVLGQPRVRRRVDYGGFRVFDISRPEPTPISDVRCYGPQGDPSVFDRDGDGNADTLVLSVDSPLTGPQCGAGPASKVAATGKYPDGTWEGIRIFDISQPVGSRRRSRPSTRTAARTRTRCSPTPGKRGHGGKGGGRHGGGGKAKSIYVMNSSYPLGEGPTCGPLGVQQGRKVNHRVMQMVEIPSATRRGPRSSPSCRWSIRTTRTAPTSRCLEHGVVAPLDDFLGCHDLSTFPGLGIVGAACGEQAQVWEVDRRAACPTRPTRCGPTTSPTSTSGTARRSAGTARSRTSSTSPSATAARPTTTKDTAGPMPRPAEGLTRAATCSSSRPAGRAAVGVPRPAADERHHEPDDRQVLLLAPRHPGSALDRYLLVNAYYRGGSSVIDFSDPTKPKRWRTPTRRARTPGRRTPTRGARRPHENDHRLLQRRPEPQLLAAGHAGDLPGGRVRLHALPRGSRPGQPGRLRSPQPAAAGAGDPDNIEPRSRTASRGSTTRAGPGTATRNKSARPWDK